MGIGDKLVWVVIIGGVLSALVFVLVMLGNVMVRRRTAALLAEHEVDKAGDEASGEGAPGRPD